VITFPCHLDKFKIDKLIKCIVCKMSYCDIILESIRVHRYDELLCVLLARRI